jgi:hypothetical protein
VLLFSKALRIGPFDGMPFIMDVRFVAGEFTGSLSVAAALRYPAKMIQENDWQAPWHR